MIGEISEVKTADGLESEGRESETGNRTSIWNELTLKLLRSNNTLSRIRSTRSRRRIFRIILL
jgi:hypothetical protein